MLASWAISFSKVKEREREREKRKKESTVQCVKMNARCASCFPCLLGVHWAFVNDLFLDIFTECIL